MHREELEALLTGAGKTAARDTEAVRPIIETFSDGTIRLGVEFFENQTMTGNPSVTGRDVPHVLEGLYVVLEARRKQFEEPEDESDS